MIGYIAPFQILDYLDRLKVVKKTSNEYHCLCPVCGDGGFKINKKQGSYKGFKCGCDTKDIREAIRPWSEATGSGGARETRRRGDWETGEIVKLAQLPNPAIDAPVPESSQIPDWLVKQGVPPEAVETRYWYAKSQWVSRFEWTSADGTVEKTIRQGHIKSNGLIEWKKGSKDWRAYKLSEATKYCQGKWLLGVEGEGCVETARRVALSAITWQGSNWQIQRIVKDLTKVIEAGARGLVYFPDHDSVGEKKAKLIESACQSVGLPCLILSPTDVWKQMPAKGDITDWVEAHQNLSTNELVGELAKAIALAAARDEQERIDEPKASLRDREKQEELATLPNWSQSDIADWLAEKYLGQLAWNTDLQEWYCYGLVNQGIWGKGSTERIGKLVKSEIRAIAKKIEKAGSKKPTYTISFINGVTALLKFDLEVDKWNEAEGLLPLQNGVLDLETRKLLPHSPDNRLTWCLPYEYNLFATCEPIQEWLLTMCGGDRALVQLMRAYLLGVVTSRTDWQKFLELIGPGGTGKSTFTRAAKALVGSENVHTTTLHKLEKSKFEPASIFGKRLVVVNDSERYAGNVDKFKNLTGQDSLPFEEKFKQSKGGFDPCAMVIVSTNEAIQSTDYTSGLARRRISVPMENRIKGTQQKNLIEYKNGQLHGEFVPYIPGLLNWVLEMDEEVATSFVKDYEAHVPSLVNMKGRTLVDTNPIADWLDNFVVYDPEARTNIGVAKRNKDSNSSCWYLNADSWLYPSYKEYSHNSGTHSVSLRRFVNLLSDLGQNQLNLNIHRERDRKGSYFVGLKIRGDHDEDPPMITGNTKVVVETESVVNPKPVVSSRSILERIYTAIVDKFAKAMDSVMDETIDDDVKQGLPHDISKDNGDPLNGKIEKRTAQQPLLGQSPYGTLARKRRPSQGACGRSKHSDESEASPDRPNGATENNNEPSPARERALCVGDRVTVDDCPGHWLWASPFTVEAIDGESAKLDLVSEKIEVSRLSLSF